ICGKADICAEPQRAVSILGDGPHMFGRQPVKKRHRAPLMEIWRLRKRTLFFPDWRFLFSGRRFTVAFLSRRTACRNQQQKHQNYNFSVNSVFSTAKIFPAEHSIFNLQLLTFNFQLSKSLCFLLFQKSLLIALYPDLQIFGSFVKLVAVDQPAPQSLKESSCAYVVRELVVGFVRRAFGYGDEQFFIERCKSALNAALR